MALDVAKIREYNALRQRAKTLVDEAKALMEQADEMEQALLEDLAEAGVPRITVDGRTTYIHRELWAKRPEGITTEQVCDGLRAAGFDQFVNLTYNSQTVSAWLRELEKADAPIPPELDGILTTTEKFSLRSTKASS